MPTCAGVRGGASGEVRIGRHFSDLKPNASIRGVLPTSAVTVVSVQWFGSEAIELTYKDPVGKVANELLYRHDGPRRGVVAATARLAQPSQLFCPLASGPTAPTNSQDFRPWPKGGSWHSRRSWRQSSRA